MIFSAVSAAVTGTLCGTAVGRREEIESVRGDLGHDALINRQASPLRRVLLGRLFVLLLLRMARHGSDDPLAPIQQVLEHGNPFVEVLERLVYTRRRLLRISATLWYPAGASP